MARKVVWADTASADLEAIAEYIGRDSEAYATALVQEMVEAARSLAEFAHRGQVVPELHRDDVRELLVYPYRLVYRIEDQLVQVIAVIHGARRVRR